jgi:hypothetical protein
MTTNNTFSNQNREENNTFSNLTELWKKGELPKGYYYAEDDGEELIIHIQGKKGSVMGDDFDLKATDWIKPIAEVPNYIEWRNYVEGFCDEHEYNLKLSEENQKLKELLKDCRDFVELINIIDGGKPDLLTKINEALK